VAPLHRHRALALARALVDGLLVGGAEAARDLPARSLSRARLYAGLLALGGADGLVRELPALRQALQGLPPQPRPAGAPGADVQEALRTAACGVLVTIVDGPAAQVLRRRGVRRPHLLIGLVAGLATSALTVPVHWRQAAARAAEDHATADLDAELAQLLEESAPD
jgi:hypothetical protein